MYLAAGATAPAPPAGGYASISAWKAAARAVLSSDDQGIPPAAGKFVVVYAKRGVGAIHAEGSYLMSALATFSFDALSRDTANEYVSIFQSDANAPSGWAEIRTVHNKPGAGLRWGAAVLVASIGVGLVWSSRKKRSR